MGDPEPPADTLTCARPGCGHGWADHPDGGACTAQDGCAGFLYVPPDSPGTPGWYAAGLR